MGPRNGFGVFIMLGSHAAVGGHDSPVQIGHCRLSIGTISNSASGWRRR